MFDWFQDQAVGLALLFAIPFGLKYLHTNVPKWLVAYVGPRLLAAARGGGATDEGLRTWIKQVTFATVLLAESRFPDEGMGPEKFAMVVDMIGAYMPWAEPFLEKYEESLGEIVDTSVMLMDKEFKGILKDAGADPKILMLPNLIRKKTAGEDGPKA